MKNLKMDFSKFKFSKLYHGSFPYGLKSWQSKGIGMEMNSECFHSVTNNRKFRLINHI